MGSKWEVNGWAVKNYVTGEYNAILYDWELLYMGPSVWKAVWIFIKNRHKYGCVKIELRA